MKEWFNLKTLFPRGDEKRLTENSYIGDRIILSIFTIFICIAGLLGNGNIIWRLGLHIKRKPFATCFLNLAVAEFGSLLFLFPLNLFINLPSFNGYLIVPLIVFVIVAVLCLIMYTSCQLLLTVISIDRCLSVLFPNWYQRHSSPVLSTCVCALIWALSLVLGVGPLIVFTTAVFSSFLILVVYVGTVLICHLIVTLSTLILLIRVCFESQRCRCGNLLKVTLLMLVSFLLLTVLMWVCVIMNPFFLEAYCILGLSLKSSMNPLIYFLAGRQNSGKCGQRMKVILQRVFKEERDTRMELQPRIPTVL